MTIATKKSTQKKPITLESRSKKKLRRSILGGGPGNETAPPGVEEPVLEAAPPDQYDRSETAEGSLSLGLRNGNSHPVGTGRRRLLKTS